MSSYFDSLSRQVHELLAQHQDQDQFVTAVADLEDEVVKTVSLATGDREFPADLREKIQSTIATKRIRTVVTPGEGEEWIRAMKYSLLFEALHSDFHRVAQRRHVTRFGMLFDDPAAIVKRRDEHDAEVASS